MKTNRAWQGRRRGTPNHCNGWSRPMTRSLCAGFLLAIALFSFPASGRGQIFKNASEARLTNGLKVIMLENHRSPIVCVQVWYRTGARDEDTGKTGLAHMLEHMMFKGTNTISGEKFARTIYELGGEQNASTSHDYTYYYEILASDRIGTPIDFESDRMKNLVLKESEFKTERMVVLEERRSRVDDDPQAFLIEQLEAAAFQSQPYHWPTIGWAEDIERLTLEDVKAFYSKFYNPSNAFIVVSGDFKKDSVLPQLEKAFGKIPPGTPVQQFSIQDPPQQGERRVLVERPAQVGTVVVAWHVPNLRSEDCYVLEVIKSILAEGKSSRLYDHLVRAKALVLESSVEYSPETFDPGLFYVSATFLPGKNPVEIEHAICEELEALKTTPVGIREIEKAKNQREASFVFDEESIFSLGQKLAEYEIALDWGSVGAYIPSIRKVTVQDIQRVASKYFTAENSTVGILVPKKSAVEETRKAVPQPAGGGVRGRGVRDRASEPLGKAICGIP